MSINARKIYSLSDAIHAEVHAQVNTETVALDRWTRRRLLEQNADKVEQVLSAAEPIEACYQNLIREITAEAEAGIYLVRADAEALELQQLVNEPGVSGEMHQHIQLSVHKNLLERFTNLAKSQDELLAETATRYRYARVDSRASELILSYLIDDAESATDMVNALRSMLYGFTEDQARHRAGMLPALPENDRQHLAALIADLYLRLGR